MQLCNVRALSQLAVVGQTPAARNVAYNAICFFYKVVQGLDPEHVRLNGARIVLCQHLVERGRDVHCVRVQTTLLVNDDAPRGNAMLEFRFPANDALSSDHLDPPPTCSLHTT